MRSRLGASRRCAEEYRPSAKRVLADMHELLEEHLSERTIATLQRALRAIRDLRDPDGGRA